MMAEWERAIWTMYFAVWRPLRHRWLITTDLARTRPWTEEELQIAPALDFITRPILVSIGTWADMINLASHTAPPSLSMWPERWS